MLLATVSKLSTVEPTLGWLDRHRPETLDAMALAPELREQFKWYLAGKVLPRHLILYGPPGFGKTTAAKILAKELYGGRIGVRWVKAAECGNVDTIRNDIIRYMGTLGFGGRQKLLVFEEATGLTPEAQDALKVPLEEYANLCKVIFLTNKIAKLDTALRSRCYEHEFARPPIHECARVLGDVLKAEGKEVAPDDVHAFTRGHYAADDRRDLRSLLGNAQKYLETEGRLPAPPIPPQAERALVLEELWRASGQKTDASEGARILDDLATQFDKYVSLPPGGAVALALWSAFAWAHEAFAVSPMLALVSPTMRAGKSTVFEMLQQVLPPKTYLASSLTSAVLYRMKGIAEDGQDTPRTQPTKPSLCVLMDEADLLKMTRDFRAVLDSGHRRRDAYVLRVTGAGVGEYSSWFPKALALIDRPSSPLPDSIRDRCILIKMERMKPGESKPKLPRHQTVAELEGLQTRVMEWVRDHYTELFELAQGPILADDELHDRAKDCWHPLMCIARLAGGAWETHARQVSLILFDATRDKEQLVELLHDSQEVFASHDAETFGSVELTNKLVGLDGRPWQEIRLTPIKLSRMLRPLSIRPRQTWTDAVGRKANKQCYHRADFLDAFERYLR